MASFFLSFLTWNKSLAAFLFHQQANCYRTGSTNSRLDQGMPLNSSGPINFYLSSTWWALMEEGRLFKVLKPLVQWEETGFFSFSRAPSTSQGPPPLPRGPPLLPRGYYFLCLLIIYVSSFPANLSYLLVLSEILLLLPVAIQISAFNYCTGKENEPNQDCTISVLYQPYKWTRRQGSHSDRHRHENFWQNPTSLPWLKKILKKLWREGTCLNIIKA